MNDQDLIYEQYKVMPRAELKSIAADDHLCSECDMIIAVCGGKEEQIKAMDKLDKIRRECINNAST